MKKSTVAFNHDGRGKGKAICSAHHLGWLLYLIVLLSGALFNRTTA